jgi:hypothetical protein
VIVHQQFMAPAGRNGRRRRAGDGGEISGYAAGLFHFSIPCHLFRHSAGWLVGGKRKAPRAFWPAALLGLAMFGVGLAFPQTSRRHAVIRRQQASAYSGVVGTSRAPSHNGRLFEVESLHLKIHRSRQMGFWLLELYHSAPEFASVVCTYTGVCALFRYCGEKKFFGLL